MWFPDFLKSKSKTIDQLANELDGRFSRRHVSVSSALEVTTVLACVSAIADCVSVPDLHVMRNLGDGKKVKAIDDPAYRILHRRPNEFQTAMEFRESITMHCALTGNGYALPIRGLHGELLELLPLEPSMVTIQHIRRYEIIYSVHDEFGHLGNFKPDQMFHIKNRSWDKLRGLNAVHKAAKAIGLAQSTEENINALQEKGGKPGGILTSDAKLTETVINRIKEAWSGGTTGKNAYKTPVLDGGLKYYQMGMSAVDQQVLETRRLQVEEICRAFGVFPSIVMNSDKASTFGSAESFFAAHNRLTGRKWQKIWREKGDEFLLDGGGPLFLEFDNREIEGASLKDSGEYYGKALGTGGAPPWMTQNEVRAERGLPPIEGGDELFKPTNAVIGDINNEPPN